MRKHLIRNQCEILAWNHYTARLELVGLIYCEDTPVDCQLTVALISSTKEWNIGGTTK